MTKYKETKRENFRWQWRNNRPAFVLWLLLRGMVIAVMLRSLMLRNYENVFICALVLYLFILPSLMQKRLGISFPTGLQIVIMIHIFACEILGEIACYYVKYPHWDTIMHTVWGFLCAAIGYSLVDILNREDSTHFKLSPAFLAVVSFCFSMTIGVMWEFFEFTADRLFTIDMQKDTVITQISSVLLDSTNSNIPIVIKNIGDVTINGESLGVGGYLDIGLYDTMEDLFVNLVGALIFSLIGFFRAGGTKADKIAGQFIPTAMSSEIEYDASDQPE